MWYSQIVRDIGKLPDFVDYYQQQLNEARVECAIRGNIERNVAALPGITEQRFNQLQEIEAVLNFLNIELRKIRRKYFQQYLENYARALSSRDVDKYVDGEKEVVDYETLINEVALLRNNYLGILKALESKSFSLNNITKLRVAGLEDAAL
jgi:uncharacterized protein YfdQ (DUF2303 family)